MLLEHAKKVALNKYTHSVRASQAVIQYGVGAIIDFPNQTLMTAAPEYWQEQVVPIHDERLEKLLHVDYFGLPGGMDDSHFRDGVSYVRFPEWYFCPKCRKFQSIKDWVKEYKGKATQKQLDTDPEMTKYLRCPTCKADLVVTRIVSVCECGHIDDFPWIQWVHCQNNYGGPKPICEHPSLTFKTSASSTEGLEGLTVTCESCKARANLKGAFDTNKFEELEEKYEGKYHFRCTGRHPWKNISEPCGKFPRVLQRSSSSVFFPVTASSLVIPPYSSLLTNKIESSSAFDKQKKTIADLKRFSANSQMLQNFIHESLDQYANEIALEIGAPMNQIRSILERKWLTDGNSVDESTTGTKYRLEEYDALSGRVKFDNDDYGDFLREETDITQYSIPYIRNVSLIHKVREVQALVGFSRLKPVEMLESENGSGRLVPIKQNETNWYPAYEVRGEGIFIEFNGDAINEWLKNNSEIQKRVDLLNDNYAKTYFGSIKPRVISGKFLLLHTLAHLLIKQLSFECGYSIASLKERLYCSDTGEDQEMSGILIYTASGDSEGTMGGLVRQGREDTLPGIFKKAIEAAMTCSNDPVCSLSLGQGRDSLNLAACYSCSLIPETSCEEFNAFLDRGVVVGTFENRMMGLYSKQLYEGAPWRADDKEIEIPNENILDKQKRIIIIDKGIDLSDSNISDVWNSLIEWSGDDNEVELLTQFKNKSEEFLIREIPRKDCLFKIVGEHDAMKCDLMWPESKTAFFTVDNEDGYLEAKESDWHCFLGSDTNITVEDVLLQIKVL